MLPFGPDGNFTTQPFLSFLEKRKMKESQYQAMEEGKGMILYPNSEDVLMGRGRPFQQFVGNLNLNRIVAEHQEEYNKVDRKSKTRLTRRIVQLIKDGNGRFLKRDSEMDGGWVVVTDAQAREKIAHAFRYNSSLSRPEDVVSDGASNAKRRKA